MRTTIVYILGVIFLFSLFPSTDIYGQRRGLRGKQVSTIDLMTGADIGFRTVKLLPEFGDSTHFLDNRAFNERPSFNYRFGISYVHGISEAFAAKIGIRLTNAGFRISKITRIQDLSVDVNTFERVSTGSSNTFYTYAYNFNFIEVPIAIRRTAIHSFCQPYFEVGLSTYFYRGTTIKELFYTTVEGKDGIGESKKVSKKKHTLKEDFSTINFLPFLSMGGNFSITKTLNGFSQIIVRKQINNLRKNYVREKLVSLGLEIGIRYHLDTY